MAEETMPKVLLVEDSRLNQELVRLHLVALGCSVDVGADGAAAVSACAQSSFDLVLMDCELPIMDGFDATLAIRAAAAPGDAHLPIVALTGHELEPLGERMAAAGMDDALRKPIGADALRSMLDRWL